MRDRPDAACLLELAREMLLGEIAPVVAEDRQQEIALLARAAAIAARELAASREPGPAWPAGLARLYGEGDPDALTGRLAQEIRAGVHDAPGPRREAVLSLLWAMTRDKLRLSNPEYLAAAEAGQASQKTFA